MPHPPLALLSAHLWSWIAVCLCGSPAVLWEFNQCTEAIKSHLVWVLKNASSMLPVEWKKHRQWLHETAFIVFNTRFLIKRWADIASKKSKSGPRDWLLRIISTHPPSASSWWQHVAVHRLRVEVTMQYHAEPKPAVPLDVENFN